MTAADNPGQAPIVAKLTAALLLTAMLVWAAVSLQRPPDLLVHGMLRLGLERDQVHAVGFPLLYLILMGLSFSIVHWVDRVAGGDGLSDRVIRKTASGLTQPGYRYDPQVVQGLLGKQSIFTALAAAMLVAVAGAVLSGSLEVSPASRLLLTVIGLGLLLTLLSALTSITCYTHALQFQWHENFGQALVRLGSKFDIASFYLLSGALLLAAALWHPWATYCFSLLFALMLLRYYFFRVRY